MSYSKSTSPQPWWPTSGPASATSALSGHSGKSKSPPVKPANVFSNDGSFLDRIRRSMKEEEGKKKEKEVLERKEHFADRFKTRGKRPVPRLDSTADSPPKAEETPQKKPRLSEDAKQPKEDKSPQAKYQKAIGS